MNDANEINLKKFESEEENEHEGKLVEISMADLRQLEKIPNSSIKEKIRYNKPINLVIEKVSVSKESEATKSNDGDRYIGYRITLHYSDGEKEGLGGFRAYLNENGKPDRFWSTEKSAGGKIKKMLEGFMELSEPMSFYQFVSNLQGLTVRVRSEDWAVLGKKGHKNLPMEIIEKKKE